MNGLSANIKFLESTELPFHEYLSRYRTLTEDQSIGNTFSVWKAHVNSIQKSIFFCQAVLRTIEACQMKDYTSFDAHTTSNCCHGTVLFARDLIQAVLELDLEELKNCIMVQVQELQEEKVKDFEEIAEWVPEQLLVLTGMYVL